MRPFDEVFAWAVSRMFWLLVAFATVICVFGGCERRGGCFTVQVDCDRTSCVSSCVERAPNDMERRICAVNGVPAERCRGIP